MAETVPIVLFAYRRPDLLRKTLRGLLQNSIPLLYAFSDGPSSPAAAAEVAEVRQVLRGIDWCEVKLHESDGNCGLGRSILSGVARVLEEHDAVIVFEDDLICMPGFYEYLTDALRTYRDDPRVMSVTGWTHPRIVPPDVTALPYFDGRAECWTWGTWRRAWQGMKRDAMALLRECRAEGIDPELYGSDLPKMAAEELSKNLWAVRWMYLHMLRKGLCMRPPYSMVEHIGFDSRATTSAGARLWANPDLRPSPNAPDPWPVPVENKYCAGLWRAATGGQPLLEGTGT